MAFDIDVIALGGYMSFLTLTGAINVHPADLSLTGADGKRTFVGDDAVMDAIVAGQSELRSSTLFTDLGVDSGPLLMVSDPIAVELPAPLEELKADPGRLRQVADANQERLKEGRGLGGVPHHFGAYRPGPPRPYRRRRGHPGRRTKTRRGAPRGAVLRLAGPWGLW